MFGPQLGPFARPLPLRAGSPLAPAEFARVRQACVLEHCKWDPQVGDHSVLAPFPVFMREREWNKIAACATQLGLETLRAESELLVRTDLHAVLGMPRTLRRAFACAVEQAETPSFARTLRFDFHFTRDGWRISEINSDVPGGFSEAEGFSQLMGAYFPDARVAGRPASVWAESVARAIDSEGEIALLSAPGYLEDAQVVAYLASRLRALGRDTRLVSPAEIRWAAGRAFREGNLTPLAGIVRFYQLEWLSGLARESSWSRFLFGAETPVSNAGRAGLSESKRFPLVWRALRAHLTMLSSVFVETRHPREVAFARHEDWVLKASYSNCGDSVIARDWVSRAGFRATWARALLNPGAWVAQRRFDALLLETPLGPLTHCLGVYMVEGRVAGAYLRLSRHPLVDFRALDAALLIVRDE
jgi:glutathionylspermidine synthase